jgi:hypothetical protein
MQRGNGGGMKVIIAGSRSIDDIQLVRDAVKESGWGVDEVVCGGAAGVDRLGAIWAGENKIKVTCFRAKWNLQGKSAGIIRNMKMGNYGDALIAVWDGDSHGTHHMIGHMLTLGKPVYIKKVEVKV